MADILIILLFLYTPGCPAQTDIINRKDASEEKIWKLEEAYFSNLYKANYDSVLALVHIQFLGWPGGLLHPLDREESARFMKQLVPTPSKCTFRIEREGISLKGDVALTQYIIHVGCPDSSGTPKKSSSRITHTWVKEGSSWRLLGGMSSDK